MNNVFKLSGPVRLIVVLLGACAFTYWGGTTAGIAFLVGAFCTSFKIVRVERSKP